MNLAEETGQSLQQKLELSKKRLLYVLHEFPAKDIMLAWSGGKDSTLLLAIFLQLWQAEMRSASGLQVVSLDTGCKFPEVICFRDEMAQKWGLQLLVAKPELDLDGYPLARDPVQCCLDLKVRPLQGVIHRQGVQILLTGARHDETPGRQNKAWLEDKDSGYLQANPILHWSEMDVWAWHQLTGQEYCPLYDQGYRSLGCMPCTHKTGAGPERGGRNQDKERQMQLLSNLGYF
ncbi:MAG: phosphoadenosine phosphosulfate reductase family protein [Desulfohalobiaceae bacterium]